MVVWGISDYDRASELLCDNIIYLVGTIVGTILVSMAWAIHIYTVVRLVRLIVQENVEHVKESYEFRLMNENIDFNNLNNIIIDYWRFSIFKKKYKI